MSDLDNQGSGVTSGFISHFTMIPHLIPDLGLTPNQFRIYFEYSRIHGSGGICFISNKVLADRCKVCLSTLQKVKKELSEPREDLGGKPLIVIRPTFKENGTQGTDVVHVTELWYENLDKSKKHLEGVSNTPLGSIKTMGGVHQIPTNNTHLKNTHLKKNNNPLPPKGGVAVFPCLEKIDVSQDFKAKLCSKYDEPTVIIAVAYATHPSTIIKETLEACLRWACDVKPSVPMSEVEKIQQRKTNAVQLADAYNLNKRIEGTYMEAHTTYLEAGAWGGNSSPDTLKYDSPDWDGQFERIKSRYGMS